MKQLLFLILIISTYLSASHNKNHYEGLEPNWRAKKSSTELLEVIALFIPSNPIVFEAGASEISTSVELAQQWPNGRIISFKPVPSQFAEYQAQAKLYPNMFGYNLDVGTANGTIKFYLFRETEGEDPVYDGSSFFLEAAPSMKTNYTGPQIEVSCVNLDDWCQNQEIETIDFMWLNLAGFELQLLQSSPNLLSNVKVIYTKTNFYLVKKGTSPHSSLNKYLKKNGFRRAAHWYGDDRKGEALYVRRTILQGKGID